MTKSKEKNERMRKEKKALILKEALRCFTKKGLSATKIKDIAEGVGMAQGLLYNYFTSKEEIYVELISDALDKMNEATDILSAMSLPAGEKLSRCIRQIIRTIDDSDEFNQTSRLIIQAANTSGIPKEAKALIAAKRNHPYEVIAKIIAAGQKEGTVTDGDPDQLAILFWTSLNGLALYKASREDPALRIEDQLLIDFFIKKEGTKICQK